MSVVGNSSSRSIAPVSLKFLDGLRGLAALYVMIGHAKWLLWEGGEAFHQHANQYSLFDKLQVYFFAAFKYGHQMVLFFFILSGFVIHLKQSAALSNGESPSLKGYFVRRARRIIPPVLFALLLTFCCDMLVQYMDASIYHQNTPLAVVNKNVSFDHSATTLAGNIAFLQNTYVPIYGSNGPLWSLKYEWWFYMVYPLLLLINRKNVMLSFVSVLLLSVLAIAGWSWGIRLFDDVFAYLICWWIGCLSADIYTGRLKLDYRVFIACSLFLLLIPFQAKLPVASEVIKDAMIAVGFFGLLNFLFYLNKRGTRFTLLEKLKWLGDLSYSLYVVHFPLLVVANGLILRSTGNKMPQSQVFIWLSIPVIVFFSYWVHLLVEKPFTGSGKKKPAFSAALKT